MHIPMSSEDYDSTPEETLERYQPYIVALVKQRARHSSNFARSSQFDLEVDDMAQRVLIKFWQTISVKHIVHHKAYLRTIVCNEFNNLSRGPRQPLPLLTDDDGEWYLGDAQELEGARSADPADEFAESESLNELMDSTAEALAQLAPRQQQAMICELHEKIGAGLQVMQALRKHRVEVKTVDWPENEVNKILLKASLSPARHKLAESLDFNLEAGKMVQHGGARQSTQARWNMVDAVVQPHRTFLAGRNELPSLDQPDDELLIESVNEAGEIEAYVGKLREPYRTAVELHCVKKHTYPQIASELNLSKGTVKSHISRGMKMLRGLLERKDAELELKGESQAESIEDFAEILAGVDGLAEPYRTAVRLHYVEKHTYPQIASELSLSKGTVKSHVSRGMKMLRRLA